ncbi:MAG TPA: cytochrome P450 [Solirubrobacteraceae bacterium]|jgi:cytochrome P450|nr:cytochrome P450 [Solirubrobacteraceae bacterium]
MAGSVSAQSSKPDPAPEADAVAAADLGSLEFWGRPAQERDSYFAYLRREAPVSRHEPPEDILGLPDEGRMDYWAIVRHEDVRRISRDPATFCSSQGVQFGDVPQELLEATQSFLAMDAPRHTKLRGLVSAAFTPRQVARIEEGIARNARQIVEDAAPTGGGDFVELIAKRLPLVTISDMIGVPDDDRERVVANADMLVSVADPEAFGDRAPLEVLGEAIWTLTQFATELAAHRERNPGDDLMTALVQAEVDGERLTHAEIGAFFVLLSVAGNDTTRHTTSHAMRELTLNPQQRTLLLSDPAQRLPLAVEEFVRWASPVLTFRRTTTKDVELHGQRLPTGEKIVLFYHSANRDDDAFADPWRFDITRDPNRHVGFGGGGPHYCLGASLARTQLRSVFAEIARVMPDIEAGEPELLRSSFIHGVKRMPCSFRARA